ncbi:Peptidase S15/CocE/NonD C-terminal [Penicillium cataractarum]|uniref:Peptidase S15/CocE/NonD C-terminal n=1 Tax=Penicillium cataractarum TaxID=2100454 RepID=A0A9W9VWK9_9EURO|nr:Peptidase S15/CocE/NonD C-terminal [Penicillium cataractarum]KAJ5390550.1 Peptidase S15/CocE/NonD C-terminal [Penicillium cataractarum]
MSSQSPFVQQTLQELEKAKKLGSFIKANDPEIQGLLEPCESTSCHDGMIIHTDVIIPTRDGVKLCGNIFRPENQSDRKLPVLLNYSVYGKDGALEACMFPKGSRLDPSHHTPYYSFEACDAPWWTQRGYVVAFVDVRGSFKSEGDKSYYSRDVGLDGYDIVEWLAVQDWSSGKVGMYGASAFAMVQWLVAAEQPPSLTAILPFDGMTDLYREMARKGGIPETQFMAVYPHLYNWGTSLVEDSGNAHFEHPFFDDYWRSKIPRLEKIKCPTYIVGILTEESLSRQKAFYDTYLHGKETELKFWPPVRYAMRESFYVSEWRFAPSFPFPGTDYSKHYPTPSCSLSKVAQPTEFEVTYDALEGELTWEIPFMESYELAGYAKLRLWVEARGADNMDLFVVLKKVDAEGRTVHFPWLTVIENGPVAFGYLRASRRELDETKTTDFQPYHSHQRDRLLEPGDVVPVDIEILPTACRFRAGDRLQISISGHDYEKYPPMIPVARHGQTINQGTHVIHFGGKYDSFLQLPTLPPVSGSSLNHGKTVKMSMVANRVKGWSDEKFVAEYTGIHANMTKQLSQFVPFLRSYTQVVGVPKPSVNTFCINQSRFEVATVLGWSSLTKLEGSFHHPSYKASAGKHVFTESAFIGSLSQAFEDIVFDPIMFENRQNAFEVVAFLPRSSTGQIITDSDLKSRAQVVREIGQGVGLLRYVLNRDITPANPSVFFKDTLFENADWSSIGAMEQYWFGSEAAAMEFFGDASRVQVLQNLPPSFDPKRTISVAGKEGVVFSKDLNF